MKRDVIYLTPAREDFLEIVKYHIAQSGPASARKISATMEEIIAKLADFPLLGQTHPDPFLARQGYRKLILTQTYIAIYKVIDGTVTIYRIVNGRTDYPKLLT